MDVEGTASDSRKRSTPVDAEDAPRGKDTGRREEPNPEAIKALEASRPDPALVQAITAARGNASSRPTSPPPSALEAELKDTTPVTLKTPDGTRHIVACRSGDTYGDVQRQLEFGLQRQQKHSNPLYNQQSGADYTGKTRLCYPETDERVHLSDTASVDKLEVYFYEDGGGGTKVERKLGLYCPPRSSSMCRTLAFHSRPAPLPLAFTVLCSHVSLSAPPATHDRSGNASVRASTTARSTASGIRTASGRISAVNPLW